MIAAYVETVSSWWQTNPDAMGAALYVLIGLLFMRCMLMESPARQSKDVDASISLLTMIAFWPLALVFGAGFVLYKVLLWRPRSVYQVDDVKERLTKSAGGQQ